MRGYKVVKKLLIGLVLISIITPVYTVTDYSILKGMMLSKEEKEIASPVSGSVFLEGEGLETYNGKGPLSDLTRKCFHDLDGKLRVTVLPGNPLSSATPYYLGVLNKAIMEDKVEGFLESKIAQNWHQHHLDIKGRFKNRTKFKNSLKASVCSVLECRSEAPKVLAAAAVYLSKTGKDLNEYARGLGIDATASKKFTESELKELVDQPDQAVAHLIARNKNDISFLHIYNLNCEYNGQNVPICGETSLWTVINFILYNVEKNKLDFSCLPSSIKISPKLKTFIEKYPNPQVDEYVELTKQDWMSLVSGIPNINYLREGYELGTDAKTGLDMLNHLFDTDCLSLTQFGEKISTKERMVKMTDYGIETLDDNSKIHKVKVDINTQDNIHEIEWKFGDKHADANPIIETKKQSLSFEDIKIIKNIMENHPTVNPALLVKDELKKMLMDSVNEGKKELVSALLDLNLNVNEVDNLGNTLLDHVLFNRDSTLNHNINSEILKLLLQKNAHSNNIKKRGQDLLEEAVIFNFPDVVRLFLNYDIDPNDLLLKYTNNNDIDKLKLLLLSGANPNISMHDAIVRLPLYEDMKVLDMLLDHGANPDRGYIVIEGIEKKEPGYFKHRDKILSLLSNYYSKESWTEMKKRKDGDYRGIKQLVRDAGMVPASEVWAKIQQKSC